ncbi:MAG: YncE family protein, partial [bacterium]
MKFNNIITAIVLVSVIIFASCRGDDEIVSSTNTPVVTPDTVPTEIIGFYLLNEGNMGSNKATLDYFDYETGVYSKN